MSDNIPFDIQMEIIKKVCDVKSLIQFRSVAKPWKAFIDSHQFIKGYGGRDTEPHRLLLRYKDRENISLSDDRIRYISFVDDVSFPHQEDFTPNVPLLLKQLYFSIVIGSSCGLWCCHGHNYNYGLGEMVIIWNPTIKKSVGIVIPSVLKCNRKKRPYFGFGVCPSTYDPTIVGISKCYHKHITTSSVSSGKKWTWDITWDVGVFTLSSKAWKMMPSSNWPRKSITLESTTQVAIDRFIYWVAFDDIVDNDDVHDYYEYLILSFDLISQEFKEVQLPDSVESEFVHNYSISKLRESLVVSTYVDGVYEIWIMGEEGAGVMTPFTKLFTIDTLDSSVEKLLGFRKSNELIMETIKPASSFPTIEVYEPCLGRTNDLGIIGRSGLYFICPYTESLLLINHADGCIISNDC